MRESLSSCKHIIMPRRWFNIPRLHQGSLRQNLGKLTLWTAIRTFQWASLIKCIPFELISKERLRVRVFQALWRRCLFYIVNVIIFGYNMFQTIGFLRNILGNGLTADSAMHVIYFAYAILSFLFFSTVVMKAEEGAMLINQIDNLIQMSQDRRLGSKRWYGTGLAILSINYYVPLLQFVAAPTLIAFFVMNPQGSMYVYCIVPPGLQGEIWVKVACFLLEAAMIYWNFTILNIMYSVWVASVFQNILWLDELKRPSDRRTYGSWESQVTTYRYIKVLNILHNDFVQHQAAGFTGALCIFAVLFIYCSLTTVDLVSIFLYILFPSIGAFCVFIIVAFYPYIASWGFKSSDFFQKIRTEVYLNGGPADREMVLRELKSLQSVRSKLSFFGYSSIGVSQASLQEICGDIFLLLSF